MKSLSLILIGTIWSIFISAAVGQEQPAPLSSIQPEIEREATTLLTRFGEKSYQDDFWGAVRRISERCNDFSVEELIGPGGLTQPVGERLPREARAVATGLAAYALAEAVDDRVGSRLGPYVKRAHPLPELATIAAVGNCLNEESREWLLKRVIDGDSSPYGFSFLNLPGESYFALQLLRGYKPDESMHARINQALEREPQISVGLPLNSITRKEALQSLLSSWRYGTGLDEARAKRYRAFQTRLWSCYACTDRSNHNSEVAIGMPAMQLLKEWQSGDEQFVLHVFEDENSTPDEVEIALYLVHKLPDTQRLQAIADGDYPQAPLAKQALSAHRYMNSIPEQRRARKN